MPNVGFSLNVDNVKLWGVLEERVSKCFPSPESHSDLATILHEEWLKVPLATVQDLYLPFPRWIDAVSANWQIDQVTVQAIGDFHFHVHQTILCWCIFILLRGTI